MGETSDNEVYAALDLGSNSFHLLLARFEAERLVVVDRYKESVRLAEGLCSDGTLTKKSINRALESLSRFAERLTPINAKNIRVVGTNTLRAAYRCDGFLERVEAILGVPVDIISGTEEARLVYQGVASDFSPDEDVRLVIDIGGGSTELVLGRQQAHKMESLHMGCVSYTRRFFPDGRITKERYRKALVAARTEVQPIATQYSYPQWQQAVGSSGTVKGIEQVLGFLNEDHADVITMQTLEHLAEAVMRFDTLDDIDIAGIDADRSKIFIGGLAILHGVFKELHIDTLHVSAYALREGILYDLAGRLSQRDKRQDTIVQMMKRYAVDVAQAQRVRALALRLLQQVGDKIETDTAQAENLLSWAIDLHEIGLSIAHTGYHKHGSYLVMNSDMPGFSRQEQKQLGFLILNHRRNLRPMEQTYGFLQDWRLLMVMRLACLFNRRRTDDSAPEHLLLDFRGQRCTVQIASQWLEDHPLTRQSLDEEAEFLLPQGYHFDCIAV